MAELKLKADSGGGTSSLKGPASSGATPSWRLPAADGSSGQFMKTNGSGVLSFATVDTSIADDSLTEAKLDIHAAPSGTDKYLGYTSNGMEWAVPPGLGKVLSWNTSSTGTAVSYSNFQSNHTVWTSPALTVTAGSTILVFASYHVWRQDAVDATHYGKIAIEQETNSSGSWAHIKGVGTGGYEFGPMNTVSFQHNYHQSWTHGQSTGATIKIRLRDEVQSPEENFCVYHRGGNGSCMTIMEVAA